MKKTSTFGNAELAKKIISQFGTSQKSVKAKMRYNKEVQAFILRVEEAHKKAAKSELIFD